MRISYFLSRFFQSAIPRQAAMTLFALAWSILVFCGEIHDAAKAGNIEKVRALLLADPNLVSSKVQPDVTPLHLAAGEGHKDIVELLLSYKADVAAKSIGGFTPLHYAAMGGRMHVVELLLANKADVNAQAGRMTPLCFAARKGYKDVVALLVASGATVDVKMPLRYTPLHDAAKGGYLDVAELLLANKADVNARNTFSFTPLHYAALEGHLDVVKLLLAHKAEVNAKAQDDWLLYSANLEAYEAPVNLTQLGETNANPIIHTPLYYAARKSHKDVVELLRRHGGHE